MLQSNDGETESLNRLLPDLTRLERLVADEGAASRRNAMLALRNLAEDNDLADLEELLAEAKPEMPPLGFSGALRIDQRPHSSHPAR